MTSMEATVRTAAELDSRRETARRRIRRSPGSRVTVDYEQGVIDTIDWLAGTALGAPATCLWERVATDEGAISAEWRAARDLEHENRASDDAVRYGGIARTIAWYRHTLGSDFV